MLGCHEGISMWERMDLSFGDPKRCLDFKIYLEAGRRLERACENRSRQVRSVAGPSAQPTHSCSATSASVISSIIKSTPFGLGRSRNSWGPRVHGAEAACKSLKVAHACGRHEPAAQGGLTMMNLTWALEGSQARQCITPALLAFVP